jgi:hypothetical protein
MTAGWLVDGIVARDEAAETGLLQPGADGGHEAKIRLA